MNRTDLQRLSILRLREAEALLNAGEYSGAYYLAGYALECAFKACIAKETQQHDFPDKKRVDASYKHSPEDLSKAANLDKQLSADCKTNTQLNLYWNICKSWSEQSRYSFHAEAQARDLIAAISDTTDGVLQWIVSSW